jgi:hypothetical protein
MSTLSSKLLSLNPTLLTIPPPMEEQSNGNDICYQNPTIYCKDLYFGMRGVVGSWFLSPQRIIFETIVVVSISYLFIAFVGKSYTNRNHNSSSCSALRKISRPPKLMRIGTTIIFTLQIIYKTCGYPGKILIMVMPCNVLWTLNMILCYYKINHQNNDTNSDSTLQKVTQLEYSKVAYTIVQLQCSYIVLAFVALANPDFSDCVLFGEVYFFIIHHFFLLYYIIHYIFITGQISTLGPMIVENDVQNMNDSKKGKSNMSLVTSCVTNFIHWIIMSCSYFAIFYFGIVTPLSIKSGFNLNYMLHPPPNQDDLVGEGYRITSIFYCAVSFTVMRFIIVVFEFMWRKMLKVILGRDCLMNDDPVKKNV